MRRNIIVLGIETKAVIIGLADRIFGGGGLLCLQMKCTFKSIRGQTKNICVKTCVIRYR